jgi:hypothetical protein
LNDAFSRKHGVSVWAAKRLLPLMLIMRQPTPVYE